MVNNIQAELRFPDDGSVVYGVLACANGRTVTVRLIEQIGSDLFIYGRPGLLVYPYEGGVISNPCRLVAEYDAGLARDIVVVLMGDPITTERRQHPRIPCHLDAAYRAAHARQAFGSWSRATVIDIGREGMALLLSGRPDFPESVEVQVTLPATLAATKAAATSGVTFLRYGALMPPAELKPIRVRAELRHRRHEGEDTVVGLKFVALPASVDARVTELLHHLTESGGWCRTETDEALPREAMEQIPAGAAGAQR